MVGPFRLLDAGRGLAALAVVIYHAALVVSRNHAGTAILPLGFFDHGALGVEVFFVISGFCIAASFDSLLRRGGGPADFGRARARRIYPTYWGAVALSAVFAFFALAASRAGVLPASSLAESVDRLKPVSLVANLTLAQAALGQPSILAVAWTLCYEIVFYAVLGGIGFVSARGFPRVPVLAGAHVLTLACAAAVWLPGVRLNYPLDMWPAFGLGVALFDALGNPTRRWVLGLCTAAVAAMGFRGGNIGYLPHAIAPFAAVSVGFTVLAWLLHRHDRLLAGTRVFQGLAWVGESSYSLYLIHFLCLGLVGQILRKVSLPATLYPVEMAVMVGFSLFAARLFWRHWESRFLGKRSAPQTRKAD